MKKRHNVQLGKNRIIGYARVSTVEQNLQMQIDALTRAGVHPDNLHVEKVSSVSARRPKLELALMDAREGDTFLVWKLDRFGRNVIDIYTKVQELQNRGVTFKSLMDHFDTSTALGKAFFGMAAVFAELERDQTIERTKRGLQAARERGFRPGAERKIDVKRAEKMLRAGKTVKEAADAQGVTPNAIRRYFPIGKLDAIRNGKD